MTLLSFPLAAPANPLLSEISPINQGAAVRPGMISVAKLDAFTDAWMCGTPELLEGIVAGDAEVFLLQLDERPRGRAVGPGQLQREPVGLMFLGAAVGQDERGE